MQDLGYTVHSSRIDAAPGSSSLITQIDTRHQPNSPALPRRRGVASTWRALSGPMHTISYTNEARGIESTRLPATRSGQQRVVLQIKRINLQVNLQKTSTRGVTRCSPQISVKGTARSITH